MRLRKAQNKMKAVYPIIFICIVAIVSCKQKTTNNATKVSIIDKYPFVEFDSMCLISIDSKDFADAIDSIYYYDVGSNNLIVSNYMKKPFTYNFKTCNANDIKIITDFFKVDSIWQYENDVACAPVYRNAIVWFNNSKIVATTLICFDCQMFSFEPFKTGLDYYLFIEDIKVIKNVFEMNGLKTKHVFEQSIVPPPPPTKSK